MWSTFQRARARGAFEAVAIGKFPVLRDRRGSDDPESTVIIGTSTALSGQTRFIPVEVDRAWQTRLHDVLRPVMCMSRCRRSSATDCAPTAQDSTCAEEAKAGCDVLSNDRSEMATRTWAIGERSVCDCARRGTFYANEVMPFGESHATSRVFRR